MSIENEIQGISYIGEKFASEHLTKVRAGQREESQGVYSAGDKHWYVKKAEKQYVLPEVLAANYFAFLLGQAFCPETRLLVSSDNNCYIMSEYVAFEELDPPNVPEHLARVLIGSFIIGDGDCLPKNLKQKHGQAFRIDFGAALGKDEKINRDIIFITSVNDLRTGFQTRNFSQRLTKEEFIQAVNFIASQQQHAFDWQSWQHLTSNTNLSLKEVKKFLGQRIHLLHATIAGQTLPAPSIASGNITELAQLTHFYELLTKEKTTNQDFIFFPIQPQELAKRHLMYREQYQGSPIQFTDRLDEAYSKQYLANNGLEAKYTELDEFILQHFPNPNKKKDIASIAQEIAANIKSQHINSNETHPLIRNPNINSPSSSWMHFFCCDNEINTNERRSLLDNNQPIQKLSKPS